MTKRIYYASPNIARLRRENGYFIDKTPYIAKLEKISNPIFLRPRRFGKSFMCSLLEHYYDVRFKDKFDDLFGDTWIGQHPTGNQNQFMVLHLNFSTIDPQTTLEEIEKDFNAQCNAKLALVRHRYTKFFEAMPVVETNSSVSTNLQNLLTYVEGMDLPRLFIIIDEYDNFANQLIVNGQDTLYRKLTGNDGFLKTFFKVLKAGRESGAIENVYITGILPMTMDELASAFNVGTYLSQDPTFEAMVGFTQTEVDWLLDEIWADHRITAHTRDEIAHLLKANYNGYHFVRPHSDPRNIPIYNTTILMYFLRYYTVHQELPPTLMDSNLKTDIGWARRLVEVNPKEAKPFMDDLTTKEIIGYDERSLSQQFNVSQFFERRFFPVSFFYLGLLTRKDDLYLTFPNLNMHQIFIEYFNELYDIDISNPYKEAMEAFLRKPDFEAFFQCYWENYILQLPETIFAQVNENFYRTTFYELCTRHFPPWFLLNVETSYPKGKSDLEFVGKNERQFAGMHWIIEFKYYSRRKMREKEINVKTFQSVKEDVSQVQGYGEGLRQKSPDAKLSMFLVYCFANEGFRVFPVDE